MIVVMKYVAASLLLLLVACLPIPQVKLDLAVPSAPYRVTPEGIQASLVSLPGYSESSTPEQYNQAMFVRYYWPVDETIAGQADHTVLILVPGIFGGASSLDIVSRQLVAATPGLEVWVLERRSNLLEDRSYMLEALERGDPQLAYLYYVENFGQADGFTPISPEDIPFVRNWSLAVHLRDLHEVVKHAGEAADRVILGGHSLGASIVGYYAAYNFASDIAVTDDPENAATSEMMPADTGQAHIDGLVLIDGALGRSGGFDREPIGLGLGALELLPGTERLREGRGSPYLTFGIGPRYNAQREVLALLTQLAPDELAPEGIYSFPLSNRAALALSEDDSYAPSTVFSSSVGEATGAVLGGNLGAALLGWDGIYSSTVTGVAPGYSQVDWQDGDVSSLAAVARAWSRPYANRSEWYFPLRLALDIAQYNVLLEDTPGFIPNREVKTPTLAVGAARGLVTSVEGFSAYSNARFGSLFSSYVIPRYTHFDIVQAEENPLVPLFGLWLEQIRK